MTNQRQPTDPERVLGVQARAYREKLGMTQDEVADAMNARGFSMRQSTIAKIEGAQRPVRVSEAVALAAVLHADLADLLADPAQHDVLASARAEEREIAGQLRQARNELTASNAHLATAQWAMQEAIDRVAAIQARYDEARARVDALAAAEGSDS